MSEDHAAKSKTLGLRVFGPPPLLGKRGVTAYNELLARTSNAVRPADFIEEIWLRDVVDLTWEVFFWRRIKIRVLKKVTWKSFYRIECVDRMAMNAEARRNAVLREIDRRRKAFAQTLRHQVQDIEDAEFQTIEPKSITPRNATSETQHEQSTKNSI